MSFPAQPFGFVAGRWVRSIGDTPNDPDRAPDYVPVETGTVTFTPQVTHRVAADGSGWAGIIKERIPARLGDRGQLIDAEGYDHLALAVGVYSVSYDFGSGRSWPSHYIEVKQEHTAEAPLWLPPIAPPPEGPMIENRVVTIPADGADGQVLVWDGAGFSWDFPPEGPQGPPGEVTTAALTAALAGKVTGQGMTVRVDTTVGTRVMLDHPGGTTMLYGDTGWRSITPILPDDVSIEACYINRTNGLVSIRLVGLSTTGPNLPANTKLFDLPQGFTPRHTVFLFGTSSTPFEAGGGAIYGAVTTSRRHLTAYWPSSPSWPTALPGTPT